MPNVAVYDMEGAKTEDIDLPDDVFGLPFNAQLLQQAVVAADHGRKVKAGKAKTRAQVDLVGAKWYAQKGLGRARHGPRSAPLFVGGGKAHGPDGKQGTHKMPKKMRRKAAAIALSERVREGAFIVLDKVELEEISTKAFIAILQALELQGRVLMLLSDDEAADEILHKSSRNVVDFIARPVPHFNARDIVWADEIVITRSGLEQLLQGGSADADQQGA